MIGPVFMKSFPLSFGVGHVMHRRPLISSSNQKTTSSLFSTPDLSFSFDSFRQFFILFIFYHLSLSLSLSLSLLNLAAGGSSQCSWRGSGWRGGGGGGVIVCYGCGCVCLLVYQVVIQYKIFI